MRPVVNTRILYTLLSAIIIIGGSIVAIRFAQGYRLSTNNGGQIRGNGLLAANSFPSGAEVYVNDRLVAATDTTLYLDPGEYQVEIRKDGYMPWSKKLRVESELVTQTNAQLFRRVPSLTPLTFAGVKNISPSPDGQKLLFYTSSASAQTKNGLYVLDLSSNFLSNNREAYQVAEEAPGFDLNKASFIWSPESTEVIMSTNGHEVLLDVTKKNSLTALPDIGIKKKQMLSEWESQLYLRERQYLARFPAELIQIATTSAKNIYLSPDKQKILYTATASATLPDNIAPALPASDNQTEQRHLLPGSTYVYDRQEDKNFLVSVNPAPNIAAQKVLLASDLFNKDPALLAASPSYFLKLQGATSSAETTEKFRSFYSPLYGLGVQWFSDSKHLIFTAQNTIYIIEYDNTNKTVVYEGPFDENFVYPWPDGSKLLILTSFSANSPDNLYAIDLK